MNTTLVMGTSCVDGIECEGYSQHMTEDEMRTTRAPRPSRIRRSLTATPYSSVWDRRRATHQEAGRVIVVKKASKCSTPGVEQVGKRSVHAVLTVLAMMEPD